MEEDGPSKNYPSDMTESNFGFVINTIIDFVKTHKLIAFSLMLFLLSFIGYTFVTPKASILFFSKVLNDDSNSNKVAAFYYGNIGLIFFIFYLVLVTKSINDDSLDSILLLQNIRYIFLIIVGLLMFIVSYHVVIILADINYPTDIMSFPKWIFPAITGINMGVVVLLSIIEMVVRWSVRKTFPNEMPKLL